MTESDHFLTPAEDSASPSRYPGSDATKQVNQQSQFLGKSQTDAETILQPELTIDLNAPPLVDLRRYSQAGFTRGRPGWFVMLWWILQGVLFPLTPHALHAPRRWLLRLFGARVGQGVVIRPSARVTFPWRVTIGDYSWIGEEVVLYSLDRIDIGKHCVVSQKSYLCTGSHSVSDPAFTLQTAAIAIGNGAWIATDCFIAPGVQIGANAVIGARSSVFKSMPSGYLCWGSPCKPQRLRSSA